MLAWAYNQTSHWYFQNGRQGRRPGDGRRLLRIAVEGRLRNDGGQNGGGGLHTRLFTAQPLKTLTQKLLLPYLFLFTADLQFEISNFCLSLLASFSSPMNTVPSCLLPILILY